MWWNNAQNQLQQILDELDQPASQTDMPRRIELCEKALELISRDKQPELWAALQDDLACSLLESPGGSRAENIEQAIDHFKQALTVRAIDKNREEWAMTQNNLGTAYKDRIRGDQADNIEQAIHQYEEALKVRTRESDPVRWAVTRHNLALAYYKRVREDRAKNLECAIQILEEILKTGGNQTNSGEQAAIHHDLGNAYRYRLYGDRLRNIEQAIDHFQQALTVRTPGKFPMEWAESQNDLGSCYLTRKKGDPEKNIEQAITLFEQVLAVHTRDSFPKGWAQAHNNLGNAYQSQISEKKAENLEKAVFHYKQALEIRTPEAFPEEWAETLNNLANIERVRAEEGDIEQAIQDLTRILNVYTFQSSPQFWARTYNNLAIMYSDRKQGTPSENIEDAIQHYQEALKVYTPHAFPDRCVYSARALGNLAFESQRWDLAVQNYDIAFEAQDALMYASLSPDSERIELTEIQNLPPRAAYAYWKLGNARRAVEVLEKGRAQLLRESFELQKQNLGRLRIPEFQHLYDHYIQARDEYTALQGGVSTEWKKPLEKLQSAAAAIRKEAGPSQPEYRFFLRTLTIEEIQEQAEENPLVYLIATHAGGLALIVHGKGVQAIDLPELEQESLQKQIWCPSNDEVERINKHLHQGYIEPEDIQAVSGGYFSMYALRRLLENISPDLSLKLLDAWEKTLDETTCWLWGVGMGKLISALKEYGNAVTLIPAGQLALLPLHAAWTEDKARITERLYALDEMNISYAPSAHALGQARLAASRRAESLLIVDNPDSSLRFSKDEVIAASNTFNPVTYLSGEQATVEAVKTAMQQSHVLHFATHGRAGWEKAEEAYVKLYDENLTLVNIFALDLNQARLAILSACETGIPGLELIDEMIGLPAGMMQAGIPGVVGSLWSVNDRSTSFLMSGFYKFWRSEGKTPQEALRKAQIWLRDTLFESPYYWAAFTYTGV